MKTTLKCLTLRHKNKTYERKELIGSKIVNWYENQSGELIPVKNKKEYDELEKAYQNRIPDPDDVFEDPELPHEDPELIAICQGFYEQGWKERGKFE